MDEEGQVLGYIKVGWNRETIQLLKNEEGVLNRLNRIHFKTIAIPAVLYVGHWNDVYILIISPPEGEWRNPPQCLTSAHFELVNELSALDGTGTPLSRSAFWQTLHDRIKVIDGLSPYYAHILKWGTKKVEEWFTDDILVPFGWRHGDFAPWNTWLVDGRLFAFDWEYAQKGSPPARDFFHFLVQTGVLLYRWKPKHILQNILKEPYIRRHLSQMGFDTEWIILFLVIHLLDVLSWELMRSWHKADIREQRMREAWGRLLVTTLLQEEILNRREGG